MSFRNFHLRAVILACLKCWPLAPCKLSVAISAANDFMDTPVTDLVRDLPGERCDACHINDGPYGVGSIKLAVEYDKFAIDEAVRLGGARLAGYLDDPAMHSPVMNWLRGCASFHADVIVSL